MRATELLEIVGVVLVLVGLGCCVTAAALVSLALGLLVGGAALLLVGVTTVAVANARARDRAAKGGRS